MNGVQIKLTLGATPWTKAKPREQAKVSPTGIHLFAYKINKSYQIRKIEPVKRSVSQKNRIRRHKTVR